MINGVEQRPVLGTCRKDRQKAEQGEESEEAGDTRWSRDAEREMCGSFDRAVATQHEPGDCAKCDRCYLADGPRRRHYDQHGVARPALSPLEGWSRVCIRSRRKI